MRQPIHRKEGPRPPRTLRAGSLLTACLFASFIGTVCSGCIRKPHVHLHDIQVKRLSGRKLDLICTLEVMNPNWFDARLKELTYEVTAGGQKLAAGRVPGEIPVIPAMGSRRIDAEVSLDLRELAALSRRNDEATIPYEFHTRPVFDVLGFSLPVSMRHRGEIPRLGAPKFALKKVRLKRRPRRALEIVFEVTNPGALALSLQGVTGALKLDGETIVDMYETTVRDLPGGSKVEVVVPVRLALAKMVRVATRAMANLKRLEFDGDLRFQTPPSLRRMLLGKGEAP